MVFVKAQGGPPNAGDSPSQFTVQYFDEEGNMTIVHKKSGSIWISKPEALQLALQGRLHAILVHLKTGTLYLRPEFGSHSFVLQA